MTSPLQQKLKVTGPSIVTANRVDDGAVIYRTAQGWSVALADAAVVRNADEARALLGAAVADDLHAVGAYVAPVTIAEDGTLVPASLREEIRHSGLTISLTTAV